MYNMDTRWAVLLVIILLALQIKPVRCPEDPCDNTSTDCFRVKPLKDMIIPLLSSVISCAILLCPCWRIKDLKPGAQSDSEILFWWFLVFGLVDYILWLFYIYPCYHPDDSTFPVLLTCMCGFLIHLSFCVVVTRKTSTTWDARIGVGIVFIILVIISGVVHIFKKGKILGWIGVGLSVLSHSFRIGSTDYYSKMNWYLFVASVVGSVNGFLWLINPQLCISREYKNYLFISLMVTGDTKFVA